MTPPPPPTLVWSHVQYKEVYSQQEDKTEEIAKVAKIQKEVLPF